ncbi:hypothetical protein ACDL92_00975 [Ihubacter sp. mB4P-1]|uniref:hypothetical protein n=1 Tax=Ihubacter sp. mB4P-1 TaxID=3242370 RepID=UPI0013794CB1
MKHKPELGNNRCIDYGYDTRWEYDDVSEDLNEVQIETLNRLVACAYKEGVRDGIFLAEELNMR